MMIRVDWILKGMRGVLDSSATRRETPLRDLNSHMNSGPEALFMEKNASLLR